MKVLETAKQMLDYSGQLRSEKRTIGIVPTMGALHAGHESLMRTAQSQCDVVIVSVFVNPTQFNQISDLEKYPRTFEADRDKLKNLNVDVMFFPSVEEIYPNGTNAEYELDGLDKLMEGPNRPGHFNGVVQVVMRLFDLTKPTKAFFGEKDFQQLSIIRHMTRKFGYEVEVVGCPTIREEDGLAMSSRNVRLSEKGRKLAPSIYATLRKTEDEISDLGLNIAKNNAVEILSQTEGVELEYLELVEPQTLEIANENSEQIQACIAVWIEDVRLIDNMRGEMTNFARPCKLKF